MTDVPVGIRPWRPGDEHLLARAGSGISAASLRSRFFAGTSRLPAAYLRYVAAAPRHRWNRRRRLRRRRQASVCHAQVALLGDRGDRLIGWAEFGRAGSPAEADIALLVLDRWQRRGIGAALLRSMLPRIAGAGVKVVHADVEPGNEAARRLVAAVLGPADGSKRLFARMENGLLHYMTRLDGQS